MKKSGEQKKRNVFLWAVVGIYLIYLGAQQFLSLYRGEAAIPALSAVCGVIFLAVGAAVLLREWRTYRREMYGTDTPEDSEEETEEEEEP